MQDEKKWEDVTTDQGEKKWGRQDARQKKNGERRCKMKKNSRLGPE